MVHSFYSNKLNLNTNFFIIISMSVMHRLCSKKIKDMNIIRSSFGALLSKASKFEALFFRSYIKNSQLNPNDDQCLFDLSFFDQISSKKKSSKINLTSL